MKIINTKLKGLKIIKTKLFEDNRGYFKEIFKNNFFFNKNFIFACLSQSKKNVLRGLHIQTKNTQAKIITVASGKIFDVAVDLRKNSKTFGKYLSFVIDSKSDFSLYIPEGFAHGFVSLDNNTIVYYYTNNYQSKKSEKSINWNDKKINIKWPIKEPILSQKDNNGISLDEYIDLLH